MENTQSSEKKRPGLFGCVVEMCINTFVYIALEYILSCCRYAFRHSPVSVLFATLEVFLFGRYMAYLSQIISKKWLQGLIAVLCLAISIAVVYLFGILDIAPALKHLT